MRRTIIKPLITEKFSQLSEEKNQYGFLVDPKATKLNIKNEVQKLYGVKVTSVRTMNYIPKEKNRYTKRNVIPGKTKFTKKAVISVKQGDVIDFYSNL